MRMRRVVSASSESSGSASGGESAPPYGFGTRLDAAAAAASTKSSIVTATNRRTNSDTNSDFGGQDYLALPLKHDHAVRPLWVCANGRIILEAFSLLLDQAQDFLSAIAEPISRPAHVHEYRISEYSLYAAVSVGLSTESILAALNLLSKNDISPATVRFIRRHTSSYGKIKVVLKQNRYWIETKDDRVRQTLLDDDLIREAVIVPEPIQVIPIVPLAAAGANSGVLSTFGAPTSGTPIELRDLNTDLDPEGGDFYDNNDDNVDWLALEREIMLSHQLQQQNTTHHHDRQAHQPMLQPTLTLNDATGQQSAAPNDTHASIESLLDLDDFGLGNDDINQKTNITVPSTITSIPKQQVPMSANSLQANAFQTGSSSSTSRSNANASANQTRTNRDNSNEKDDINNRSGPENQPSDDPTAPLAAQFHELLENHDEMRAGAWKTQIIEIRKDAIETVKRRCADLSLPALEEYEFHADTYNPNLRIDLKSSTKLRPYQEKSLSKLFGNGRARSGVIVLPCGAGKTLVGVTAACTIKKSCLVLCSSSVSVEQWAREFRFWSTLQDGQIARFTSGIKERFSGSAGVMISTYTMISYTGKRAYDAQQLMDFIQSREWGLLLLDEVHIVPADMFRKVFTIIAAHAKLGLTATLVREDNKIDNLNYLIGPKLYEANWMELARCGHIANVQCAEVWCTMTPQFYREYLRERSRKRQLLYTMNPSKIQACQYLINFHEAMGDKIIVFSDNIFALKHYSAVLNRPYIYGGTSQSERIRVLQQFRFNPALNTIFISKIGDTSIDLPEASCLIQISSHYGSRRQEAQRLGRILRAKRGSGGPTASDGFNAFFYSLVSRDTQEMFYATKRQQFLVDQGYNFRIITQIEGMDDHAGPGLVYSTLRGQLELLNTVLISNETEYDEDDETEIYDGIAMGSTRVAPPSSSSTVSGKAASRRESRDGRPVSAGSRSDVVGEPQRDDGDEDDSMSWMKRTSGSIKSLSGADTMAYLEFNRGTTSGLSGSRKRRRGAAQE